MNIHSYPPKGTPEKELLQYQIAVMQAAANGQPVEFRAMSGFADPVWCRCIDVSWNWGVTMYRIASPKIAAGHNPNNLTEEQVGVSDGWRLLSLEEANHFSLAVSGNRHLKDAECFYPSKQGWHPCESPIGWRWSQSYAFRTKHPAGFYLPKKKVRKLVPWTFDTAPKGLVLVRPNANQRIIHVAQRWSERRGVGFQGGNVDFEGMLQFWTHSLDGGKTWSPCGVETEVEE
jgi:hypothetical protein